MTPSELRLALVEIHAWLACRGCGSAALSPGGLPVVTLRVRDATNAVTVETCDRTLIRTGLDRELARLAARVRRHGRGVPVEGKAGDGVWRERREAV